MYLKAKQYGRYIYFETRESDPLAGQLFGLLGYVLSRKGVAFILDTETGKIRHFDQYTLFELTRGKFPEILKEFKDSKRKLADLEKSVFRINKKYKYSTSEE